ncbi:hypothetical protein [Sphingomonas sp. UNC305MFCol5.2]|uniref:hypothetical protein n=1 Tax=Sphingomonas sp. UNC305MFCol5.2 TaxID=1449076 RepID=UPI0012DE7465|nr:hypothetical protein [Sphingomonas sp. UNC305MFCol5.2]
MARSVALLFVVSMLPVSALATETCPPKPNKPCLNAPPPKGPRTGPVIIPTVDQFASRAEFRAKLREYQARSTADLKAGNINKATHDSEMRAIGNALGRSGN